MKKIIRYLVVGLVVAIAFLAASVAIFVAVFDANAYKQDLSDLVREQTGRELQFHGDVDLTIYPALGMKLGAMSLSNAEGFGAQPMIKVKQVSISVDMASLITLAPQIDKLVMRDLELNLITNKVGVTNWDDLLQSTTAPTGETTDAAPTGKADADAGFEIEGAFAGLDLENIKLLWLDEQAGSKFEILDLDLGTGRIEPNKPFTMTVHLDASASGDLDIVFDFKSRVEYLIDKQQLTFSEMELALNEFAIGGRLQLSDFAKPTPTLRFDLTSENLDVDALLGTPPPSAQPAAGTESSQQTAVEGSEDVKIELPVKLLRELDIDGKLGITRMKAQNLHMQDVAVVVKAQNGLIGLEPLTLSMYGGTVETAVVIDVKFSTPKYGVDESVQAVQVGDLLKDFSGEESVSGSLNAEANLTTSGEWLSELKKNSNGSLQLAFLDGALNGFNIRHSIDSAKAKLRGKEPLPREELKTDFSSLTMSGVIKKGVFSSADLDLQAPLLRVGGRGSADLNTETVDYLVEAKLVGTVEGQQGEAADELAGLNIPVSIKGPFAEPKIDVLLDEMMKARATAEKERLKSEIEAQKDEIRQQLEAEKKALEAAKKKQEIKDKAKKKLEDKLNKLFD
ncbi:MAG: AsmA family protein [Gammaproteobacteria bacterium]|nr:AsmA family protein [Gammaproteobacteria bacterium]